MSSFNASKQGYYNLWNKAKITSPNSAKRVAEDIISKRQYFQPVENETDVPWWLVGAWLYRESDVNINTYLGNGQSLSMRTTIVPTGRGPFPTFQAGALDAIRYEDTQKGGGYYKIGKQNWTIEY